LGGFGRLPKPALAGLLMLLLLVATTCSASHALHQALHHHGVVDGHLCLVCSLVKGQVTAASIIFISVVAVFCCLGGVRLATTAAFPGSDYRISLSRAPPLT
jgi:hypothetical protein